MRGRRPFDFTENGVDEERDIARDVYCAFLEQGDLAFVNLDFACNYVSKVSMIEKSFEVVQPVNPSFGLALQWVDDDEHFSRCAGPEFLKIALTFPGIKFRIVESRLVSHRSKCVHYFLSDKRSMEKLDPNVIGVIEG